MAIAFGEAGAAAVGTTPLTVPYPANITAGQLLVLFVGNKYPTNGPSTPTDWTAPSGNQYSRGGGTPGADTGDVYITVYVKIATGSESGNLTVTVTGANTSIARMFRVTKDASKAWEWACAGGSDNAAGTTWSVTAGSDPGVTTADMVFVGSCICGNTDTATAEAVAQTGVTFGTMVERQDSGSNTGDDISLWITEHPVSSGTGSAAPSYTATVAGTGSANAAGASLFLRLREVTAEIIGTLSSTLDALTTTTDTDVEVQGTATNTLAALTPTTDVDVEIQGASTPTLAAVTLAADGTVSSGPVGDLNVTLGALTSTTDGDVAVQGTSTPTLGALTLGATGVVEVQGAATPTLGAVTSTTDGDVLVQGAASPTLDMISITTDADVTIQGAATPTLAALTATTDGDVEIQGTAANTLAALTLDATGGAPAVTGDLNVTLGALSASTDGDVLISGVLDATLEALGRALDASVAINGTLDSLLGTLTLVASAIGPIADEFGFVRQRTVIGYSARHRRLTGATATERKI